MNALVLSTVILAVIDLLAYFTFADYNIKTNKLTFESKTNECKRAIYMFAGKDSFTIRSKDNVYLEAHDNKTVISSLNVYGNVHTNEFLFFQTNQWKLYYINTFDRKDNSWSPSHRELKIKLRVHFFDIWENDSLFLQVDNKTVWTESHQSCSSESCSSGINLCGKDTPDRLSVIRKKRGKNLEGRKEISPKFLLPFTMFTSFPHTYTYQIVPIGVELEHTSDTVNILIGNTLKKKTDACTTSWGIDDFVVYYK
ncbi:conserved Plasmodium protein, unknown function [Plasmodium malariae]|uniref:Uncharacterized protein n=1 Tax=Plasmodium malariae TaxID=5858 RepID=A0A1A8WQY8_PLAMA|nr:conserved Plasmodium protein, unknown function [Plasmodium malariae]